MASLIDKFNATRPQETRKVKDLKVDVLYPVIKLQRLQTKFGPSLVATLSESDTMEEFKVFLPKRYGEILAEGETAPDNLALVSKGIVGSTAELQLIEVRYYCSLFLCIYNRICLSMFADSARVTYYCCGEKCFGRSGVRWMGWRVKNAVRLVIVIAVAERTWSTDLMGD